MSRRRHVLRASLGALLLAATASATDTDANASRAANENAVSAAWTAARAAETDQMLVRRGLVANRETHEVRVLAEATGISASEPVEFFLIGPHSGHDYEALAISFARAEDIDAGLQFIGMNPGRPVNYDIGRMWPKGERVRMIFEWKGNGETHSIAAEDLLVDDRTGKAMAADGMVYTGSIEVVDPGDAAKRGLAADLREPYSIAANYNEPTTLLDVPIQAVKGIQYEHLSANARLRMPKGQLIEVVLRPESVDGTARVRDLKLHLSAPEGRLPLRAKDLRVVLRADDGKVLTQAHTFEEALVVFAELTAANIDPFVSVTIGPQVALKHVREAYLALAALEGDRGIRLEPPAEGQLFYKAFLGAETFRDRKRRPSQPWELHLNRENETVSAHLELVTQTWNTETGDFDYEVEKHTVAAPADLPRMITTRGEALEAAGRSVPPVILTFAPEDLPYGVLVEYLAPLLPTHPIVYVFL